MQKSAVLLLCWLSQVGYGTNGNGDISTLEVPVIKNVFHEDGSYQFGFRLPDQRREETRKTNGEVTGSFWFRDPEGDTHETEYTAGRQGFVATGNMTQGNMTQGNMTQGNMTQGNMTQGVPSFTSEVEKARKDFLKYHEGMVKFLNSFRQSKSSEDDDFSSEEEGASNEESSEETEEVSEEFSSEEDNELNQVEFKKVQELNKSRTVKKIEDKTMHGKNRVTQDQNRVTQDQNGVTQDQNRVTQDQNGVTQDQNGGQNLTAKVKTYERITEASQEHDEEIEDDFNYGNTELLKERNTAVKERKTAVKERNKERQDYILIKKLHPKPLIRIVKGKLRPTFIRVVKRVVKA